MGKKDRQHTMDLGDDEPCVRVVLTNPTGHIDFCNTEFNKLKFKPVVCNNTGVTTGLHLLIAGVSRLIVSIFNVDNKGRRVDD